MGVQVTTANSSQSNSPLHDQSLTTGTVEFEPVVSVAACTLNERAEKYYVALDGSGDSMVLYSMAINGYIYSAFSLNICSSLFHHKLWYPSLREHYALFKCV